MSRPALWPCLVWGKLFDSIFRSFTSLCVFGPFLLRFTMWLRAYKVHTFIKTCPSVCQDTCPFISALSFQSSFLSACICHICLPPHLFPVFTTSSSLSPRFSVPLLTRKQTIQRLSCLWRVRCTKTQMRQIQTQRSLHLCLHLLIITLLCLGSLRRRSMWFYRAAKPSQTVGF